MTVYTVIDRHAVLTLHIHTHNIELTLKTLYIYSEHTTLPIHKEAACKLYRPLFMNTPIFLYIV
jgi:hypothetical protein